MVTISGDNGDGSGWTYLLLLRIHIPAAHTLVTMTFVIPFCDDDPDHTRRSVSGHPNQLHLPSAGRRRAQHVSEDSALQSTPPGPPAVTAH
jgi:hypothetical protein